MKCRLEVRGLSTQVKDYSTRHVSSCEYLNIRQSDPEGVCVHGGGGRNRCGMYVHLQEEQEIIKPDKEQNRMTCL